MNPVNHGGAIGCAYPIKKPPRSVNRGGSSVQYLDSLVVQSNFPSAFADGSKPVDEMQFDGNAVPVQHRTQRYRAGTENSQVDPAAADNQGEHGIEPVYDACSHGNDTADRRRVESKCDAGQQQQRASEKAKKCRERTRIGGDA